MSIFSGKCDLYDHIMMEKQYQKQGCYISDEMECFEIFKQKTNGTIYQHQKIEVSKLTEDFIAEKNVFFKVIESGKRYSYFNVEYTKNQINKKKVYIELPIKFETLLDIIPYYPYIITSCACNSESEHIIIDKESYVDREYKEMLNRGRDVINIRTYYKQRLQEHYLEAIKSYYFYNYDNRQFSVLATKDRIQELDGNYVIDVYHKIDPLHKLEYVFMDELLMHYTSPEIYKEHYILLNKQDVEGFLKEGIANSKVLITYVLEEERPKILN